MSAGPNYMWQGKVSELPMPMDEREKMNEVIRRINGIIDAIDQIAQNLNEVNRVINILKQSESVRALVNIDKQDVPSETIGMKSL